MRCLQLVLLGGLILTGCATATVEEVEPGVGGVITIKPKDSEDARSKAKALMADNCGSKKAKIVKEGYAVVGSQTQGSSESHNEKQQQLFSKKKTDTTVTSGSSTSHDVKEWRLTYKCQ